MREAGLRVQANVNRFTVAGIIRTYRNENRVERQRNRGGRGRKFTDEQETEIINMVLANNVIRIHQIQHHIINDATVFNNIVTVSLSTIHRVLQKNQLRMKQLYRVPFERNCDRVKNLRHDFVDRILEMDADGDVLHEYIYIDEVGFNLTKTRRRGRNIIGQRAILNVPGQRGGNITMCAAITNNGVLHHHATLGPYNTAHIITFLDAIHRILVPGQQNQDQQRFVVIWDNVSFHRAHLVQNWFVTHPHFSVLYLPPYSPFLNPIEEFFSTWRWRVYDRRPYARIPLLQAMEEACGDIDAVSIQGWMRHARRFFPRCLARENIACDVDEVLWPDPARRRDEA
ncbi:uncharacterized protein LOC121708924 [Alosa sapidissima]|uniref:uncharacterized protein LOC121708924 n=1 Tax=Alosa sapidissima TaxID=34773 RepID=UPI001C09D104|nr:uncharacterized protein LOC121708924 [Alosa sapidissima]